MAEALDEKRPALPAIERISPLQEDGGITLWRARRRADGAPVLLKMASPAAAGRLRREFSLGERMRATGGLAQLQLIDAEDALAIVVEAFDGVPLARAIPPAGFAVADALAIGVRIAEALRAIHAARALHGRISPAVVLYDARTGAAKLWSLGGDEPDADLSYVSPEQTGRVGHPVDYRSDLYALGALLYHVCCGRPPFVADDPLELVHSHLARLPADPRILRPDVPPAIAEILLKLLAKEPRDRYQSAAGLLADLEECRARLARGAALASFRLGEHDGAEALHFPERLYGRAGELAALESALSRAAGGAAELALVAGYSGSGKSALVEQLRAPASATGGLFLVGKFEQLGAAVPYGAIRQAFRALVQLLEAQGEGRLAELRERLLPALAGQGQVIVDVIPDVERLLGAQPPVEPLGPLEAQYRFTRVFQQFVRVLAASRRPLILFLDDWQWADEASIRLIESLAATADAAGLLLIGAYRDNELHDAHPVSALIGRLRAASVRVTEIAVRPLDVDDIAGLLADTLRRRPAEVRSLALELERRTSGNPFFLRAFLRDLCDSHVLGIAGDGAWHWDIDELARARPPENVVALMASRLTRLPQATRDILKVAACLGSAFTAEVLACASGRGDEETLTALLPAFEAGAVLKDDKGLRFLHDRVQEAAYSLVERGEEAALHLAIGRRLTAAAQAGAESELLAEAVQHLNAGRALIEDEEELRRTARLNLQAGRVARRSTAYRAAAQHAAIGLELLGAGAWQSDYDATLGLYELRAECEYLVGNFDFAETLYPVALAAARTDLDRIRILNVQKDQYELQGRYLDAIGVLRKGLALVGITFADDAPALQAALRDELAQMPANLGNRRIAELVDAPTLDDPLRVATLKMLMGMWPSCYVAGLQELLAVVSVKIANFSLRHGNCEITSAAYVNYSFVAGFLTGDYEQAYEYGKAGIALAERYPERSVRAWCYFLFGCGTLIWRSPLGEGRPYLERAVELGKASGNIACASYAASYIVTDSFMRGASIAEARALYEEHFPFLQQNNPAIHLFGELGTLPLREMAGMPAFDEQSFLRTYGNVDFFMAVYLFGKLAGTYHFGRADEALELAERALDKVPRLLAGTFKVPETLFYAALTFVRSAEGAPREHRERLIGRARELHAGLDALARRCSANVAHKARLVEAELARADGRRDDALAAYEEAAALAAASGFVQDQALAYELAAAYWQARALPRLAAAALRDAIDAYARWGAQRKARALERRLAELGVAPRREDARAPQAPRYEAGPLDMLSVTKASQAISSEIDFDRLVERLIRILGENAGARRAVLLLQEGAKLVKAATADLAAEGAVRRERGEPQADEVPLAIVQAVARRGESLLLGDAWREGEFTTDPFVRARKLRSVLCLPVRHKDAITGVLYLENDLSSDAFTPERIAVLELLLGQVAISLENARLYAELKDSEERLSSVFSQALAGIARTDLGGRFVEVNSRYCEIVGRSAGELQGMRMQDITHPEDLPRNVALFAGLVEGREPPFMIEKRYLRPDGSEVWVSNSVSVLRDRDGRPKHAVAMSLDITDRRRAEAALDKQNSRIRLLWEAAAVLLTTGDPHAMLQEVFARIRGSLGLDAYWNFMVEEPSGVLRLASYGGVAQADAEALARGGVPPGIRACANNTLLAGSRRLGTLAFGSRVRDSFGADELEFLQTVTQYVTVAYERLRLIDELREQDARKDEFLATLAHELRNPLAPIRNGLQLVRLAGNDPDTLQQARAMMERQVQQMVRLVDDLLDVSRISRNKLELRREWVDLAAVVKSALETSRPLIEGAGHQLSVTLPARPVVLDADAVRLAQALANLLNNAAKYTPAPGGRIAVEASDAGNEAVIRVRDNGIGIPASKLAQIFDMFVQVDSAQNHSYGGLGIGLTLVRRLVQMHGGTVSAHSAGPGKGSEFVVRLPVVIVAASMDAGGQATDTRPASARRRRVLVADDNRDAADSLAMILKHLGHEVATAHEGLEAVRLASTFRPEIALLDIGMPNLNGYEAARLIRAQRGNESVLLVALTGWGQEQDRRRSTEAGFHFHLVKPVEPAALERLVSG